jgi:hypothetical protein
MQMEKRLVFPLLLIGLNMGAAVVSFWGGDWRRGVYWLASSLCLWMVAL